MQMTSLYIKSLFPLSTHAQFKWNWTSNISKECLICETLKIPGKKSLTTLLLWQELPVYLAVPMPVSFPTLSRWRCRRDWGKGPDAETPGTAAESRSGWVWRILPGTAVASGWGACGLGARYGYGSQILPATNWGFPGPLKWAGCHAEPVLNCSAGLAPLVTPKAQTGVSGWS